MLSVISVSSGYLIKNDASSSKRCIVVASITAPGMQLMAICAPKKEETAIPEYELKFAFPLEPTICYCGSREERDFSNQSKSRFIVFGVTSITAGKRKRKIEGGKKKKVSSELQSKEIEDVINGIENEKTLGIMRVSVVWVCEFFLIPFDLFRPGRKKKCETNLKKYVTWKRTLGSGWFRC
ncbi:hypothetical protein CDAR_124401 [Caerostris darwini]|uniref:Uncharacterized protein n=1 Tax=Caerostris darwini TaxID=1538125 RepID=A0AAV4W625_9ARAC|nr:hypothetical protein CDAR_124401 [Caerostris darwini]